MTPAEQVRLVEDCIRTGVHFTYTVRYIGEGFVRCHGCGCPDGWIPPRPAARKLTGPTGQPIRMVEPTGMFVPRVAPGRPEPLSALLVGPDPAWPQPCGTHAAAARHRRRREPLCLPCRQADAAYTQARRSRQAAAA